MELTSIGFGVALGVLASEVSWRVLQPVVGAPKSDPIGVRRAGAVAAIVSGVAVIFVLDRVRWAQVDSAFWVGAVVAYAFPFLWQLCQLFDALFSGRSAPNLTITIRALNWLTLASLLVSLVFAISYLSRENHIGPVLCAVTAPFAIGVLVFRELQ